MATAMAGFVHLQPKYAAAGSGKIIVTLRYLQMNVEKLIWNTDL